ncbi:MAG: hypothetical protein CME64_01425 [Halobacteriovoraceae bacterium]|nr:hypothetical protein [Halobacteriovoraceae bacterium]
MRLLIIPTIFVVTLTQANADHGLMLKKAGYKLPQTKEIVLNQEKSKMTFKNTQKFSKRDYARLTNKFKYVQSWENDFKLPAPNNNDSSQTEKEISELIGLKKQRTNSIINDIQNERNIYGFRFGAIYGNDIFFNYEKDPVRDFLLEYIPDLVTLTFKFKNKFNRVRPSFLSNQIKPIIPIPEHPAYPSAHSSKANFIAIVLSNFSPCLSEVFKTDGKRIAKNREIAGVHYSSDSKAGAVLARQYYDYIMRSEKTRKELMIAKSFWKENYHECP